MTSQIQDTTTKPAEAGRRQGWVAGAILIGIGLLALLGQFIEGDLLELIFLPGLAAIFLVWGIVTRNGGLMIPGGILAGIGLGAILASGPYAGLGGEATGGVFLLSFALGWGLITLLTALFTDEVTWWPLIPGGIMAVIGGGLLAGGVALQALDLAGRFWPVALIAIGLYLLFKRSSGRAKHLEE
jgi:hypothetical protein